jgi:NitT/TauT family transport system substrate-binding protein
MILRHLLAALLLVSSLASAAAQGELKELKIAIQFGIAYLPLLVAEKHDLIATEARAAGLGPVKASLVRVSGAPAVNDAVLSGSVEMGAYGTAGFLNAWDRSKGRGDILGLCGIAVMPTVMNAIRPDLKTLRDVTPADRIAVPSTTSPQAIVLRMAAEQAFGPGQHGRFDAQMVSLPHPEGVRILLSGKEIAAHVTSPPFDTFEAADPRVHRVFSADDIVGGPSTFIVLATPRRIAEANPRLTKAVLAAVGQAMEMIRANPREAAEIYVSAEKATTPLDLVEKLVRNPDYAFATEPVRVMKYVEFMGRTGLMKNMPTAWTEMFLPLIHDRPGS